MSGRCDVAPKGRDDETMARSYVAHLSQRSVPFEMLVERYGDGVVGFDVLPSVVESHQASGRRVVLSSATDADFWDRLEIESDQVELVLLAMSSHIENKIAINQLRVQGYAGLVAATARYADELDELRATGADVAYHVLSECGPGFVRHALNALDR